MVQVEREKVKNCFVLNVSWCLCKTGLEVKSGNSMV